MRVLWMIDSLGPGGAESLMLPLLQHLDRQVIEPRVCVLRVRAGNPIALELEKIGIPVDMVAIQNLRNPSNLKRLMRYIRQCQPDIIHTQLETSDTLGTLAARLLHIPCLTTVHTLDKPSMKRKTYWRNLIRWQVLKAFSSRVLAVSEITRQYYRSLGFNPARLLTRYNGINLSRFMEVSLSHSRNAEFLGLPVESVILATVAVLREPKGIQYMLEALPGLLARVPNLYYVIAGDGIYRDSLEARSRSLGVEDHVLFLGYRADIPQILASSNMFVFPTLRDALPTVLLEAMAAGVPIVASRVGGVPEIIENEVTGLLVPPSDPQSLVGACLRLLEDEPLASRLAEAARQRVRERFDIREQVQRLVSLYQEIVTEHGN